MYYKAFSTGKFGYSAALSFIIAIVLAILAVLEFKLMKNNE
jgi:multiple sugar transport system permease protein